MSEAMVQLLLPQQPLNPSVSQWKSYELLSLINISFFSAQPQSILEQPDVALGEDGATAMWVYPGGTVDTYIVQYSLADFGFSSQNTETLSVNGTETSVFIPIEDLPGSEYILRVAAENENGRSVFSPLVSFTSPANNGVSKNEV